MPDTIAVPPGFDADEAAEFILKAIALLGGNPATAYPIAVDFGGKPFVEPFLITWDMGID